MLSKIFFPGNRKSTNIKKYLKGFEIKLYFFYINRLDTFQDNEK